MKKFLSIFTTIALLLSIPILSFAAGTITAAKTTIPIDGISQRTILTLTCTGDASNGSFPAFTINPDTYGIKGWFLESIETDPGSTAPTNLYDITLTDASGFDLAYGFLADRSSTTTELVPLSAPITASWTWTITNNSVNSAAIVAKLTFSSSPVNTSLAPSEAHAGEVGGKIVRIVGTLTRPADIIAYTAGDAVTNSTSTTVPITLSNVARVKGKSAYLVGLRLETNQKSITPRFKVHFFSASTPTVSVDNAAYQEKYTDSSIRRGYVELPAMSTSTDTTNSDMSRSEDYTIRRPITVTGTDLYVVLETMDAFTPTSGQLFNLIALFDQN